MERKPSFTATVGTKGITYDTSPLKSNVSTMKEEPNMEEPNMEEPNMEEPNMEEPTMEEPDDIEEPTMEEPEPVTQLTSTEATKSDTVIIIDKPSSNVLSYVSPQQTEKKHKYWHFTFKTENDQKDFTKAIKEVGANTVEYDVKYIKNADVTLKMNGIVIGKIHFLLMDRRDFGNESQYYIKIFLYQFSSDKLEKAKKLGNITILSEEEFLKLVE